MNLAANQYKIQVQNNNWRTMSEQDQKILALESKLDKYEKSFNSLKGLSSKKTPTGKSGSPPNHQKSGNSKQTNNGKGKSKPFDFPTWMTIHPGQDFITAGKPKIVTGKSYWWCKNHKRFVIHKESECRLNTGIQGSAPTMQIFSALQASLMEE
jgi:hypothetical protein